MKQAEVSASAYIDASPETVYAFIADYREKHPRMLPARYLRDLRVEAGGTGAGTRIRFTVTGLGPAREMTAEIEEPVPGRVLAERNVADGGVTTFTVDPEHAGSLVTIQATWTPRGLRGFIERLLVPRFLRKVFRAQLDQLREVIAETRPAKL